MNSVNVIKQFVVHHSASNPDTTSVRDIRKWHVEENGWDDVGYHRIITGVGMIEIGRDLTYDPAAQLGHNDGTFAVCVVGDNTKDEWRWRREQVHALLKLWVSMRVLYPSLEPFGHRDLVKGTECPGVDIRSMLLGPRYGRVNDG
jgi:N-acetylmuramoyl-L-alanine amidase